MDFFPTDVESDSDQFYGLYGAGRDSRRTGSNWTQSEHSNQQLSRSIQGFTTFDTSLMDEDDIPTRDAGLDLSYSNLSNSVGPRNESEQNTHSRSLEDAESSKSTQTDPCSGVSKKKKAKSKRRKDMESSRNNNSLNFQEKLEQIERGEFYEEEVKPEDCGDLQLDQRPSRWEVDNPFELVVTSQNVDTLLVSARYYQQSQVISLCKEALQRCDVQDALYYRFVAEKHELMNIAGQLADFVRANFLSIVHTHSFLGLGLTQLRTLLSDDGLEVSRELDVFDAARAWLDHCKHLRIKRVGEVMACVRFIHISPEDIVRHVEPHKNYFRGPGGREVLLSIYRYHALSGSQRDLHVLQADLPPPRRYVPLSGREHTSSSPILQQPQIGSDLGQATTRSASRAQRNISSAGLGTASAESQVQNINSAVSGCSVPASVPVYITQTPSQTGSTGQAQRYLCQQAAGNLASEAQLVTRPESSQQMTPKQLCEERLRQASGFSVISNTASETRLASSQRELPEQMRCSSSHSIKAEEQGGPKSPQMTDDYEHGPLELSVDSGRQSVKSRVNVAQQPSWDGSLASSRACASSASAWNGTYSVNLNTPSTSISRTPSVNRLQRSNLSDAQIMKTCSQTTEADSRMPSTTYLSTSALHIKTDDEAAAGKHTSGSQDPSESLNVNGLQRQSSQAVSENQKQMSQSRSRTSAEKYGNFVPYSSHSGTLSQHSEHQNVKQLTGYQNYSVPEVHPHLQDMPMFESQNMPSERLVERVPSERLVERVPSERLVERVPSERLVERVPSERLVERVPSERLVERVPSERLVERVPSERLVERVPSERHVERVPSERLVERVPSERLVERVPSERLVERVPSERQEEYTSSHQQQTEQQQKNKQSSTSIVKERCRSLEAALQKEGRTHQPEKKTVVLRTDSSQKTACNPEEMIDSRDPYYLTTETNLTFAFSDVGRDCTCRCACFPHSIKQHEHGGVSTLTEGLSEKQLSELEERIKLRRLEIEKKALNEPVREDAVHTDNSGTDIQSITSVRVHYCRSPQCSPRRSPNTVRVIEHFHALQEEASEEEKECSDANTSHCHLLTEAPLNGQRNDCQSKHSAKFRPKNADPDEHRQQLQRQRYQQERTLHQQQNLHRHQQRSQQAQGPELRHRQNCFHTPEQEDCRGKQRVAHQQVQHAQHYQHPLRHRAGRRSSKPVLQLSAQTDSSRAASPVPQRRNHHVTYSPQEPDQQRQSNVFAKNCNISNHQQHSQKQTPLPQSDTHTGPQQSYLGQRDKLEKERTVNMSRRGTGQAWRYRSQSAAVGKTRMRSHQLTRPRSQSPLRGRDPAVSKRDHHLNENASYMQNDDMPRELYDAVQSSNHRQYAPYNDFVMDRTASPEQSPLGTGLIYRNHPYTNHGSHNMSMYPNEALVVVVGGLNPRMVHPEIPCRLIDSYDPTNNAWHLIGKLPEARHHHGCVMLDGYLYVIGGALVDENDLSDMSLATSSCYRYDLGGNFWTAIGPMSRPRMYHSVAVLEGVIYSLGGETSHYIKNVSVESNCFLDSCEYYNADCDQWGPMANMTEGTIGVAVIGFRGLLWVIGGFVEHEGRSDRVVLATVECYDPRTNSWISMNPLPMPVCHAGVVEVMDTLFLVGGATVIDPDLPVVSLGDLLQYLEVDDVWVKFSYLTIPRHDAACCSIGTSLFVLGGVCSMTSDMLQHVECIDVSTGERNDNIEPMSSPAVGLACVSIVHTDF